MKLEVILDSNPRDVEIHKHATCGTLTKLLLEKHGHNLNRDWQLKGSDGTILGPERSVQDAFMLHGEPFYLSLKPGWGS